MLKTKLKVDLNDIYDLSRKYPEISGDVRKAKVTEAVALLEGEIKKRTPWGAGPIHLRDTIHGKVASTLGQRVTGMLGTPLEHGEPVELGTKPHFPPIGPIQHWVETKLGYSGDEARSVAFAIVKTIGKRGTKGAHMFDIGFKENESKVMRILNEIGPELIRRLNE